MTSSQPEKRSGAEVLSDVHCTVDTVHIRDTCLDEFWQEYARISTSD